MPKTTEKKKQPVNITGIDVNAKYIFWGGIITAIIAGLFLYLSSIAPIELQITATQTAEVKLTQIANTNPATATSFVITPTSTPITTSIGPTISMLGQDGADYAVSGCSSGGTLGLLGHIDNHIRISAVKNLDHLSEVDIRYSGAHWHDPCEGTLEWQIVVKRSGVDQLDLYFESATEQSVTFIYNVTLQYTDGTEDRFTVSGPSGTW